MSSRALTAKYRPQTFGDVAGQDTVKAILSRASAEDKVAPAYLFSGTRGVGKTTIARIFAKALNCRTAPAAEPCNACDTCRSITLGTGIDVVEIDGASNRGIDDVRRLKEVVGYAPMDGRYKIFIIDEAHMLSREAFNALLKTLEEPPARVTFIMATTEAHKFPATIISRCQHFVFKPLAEQSLATHLANILNKENLGYDEGALRLIARRGAGSVRDSMSLLGQVLALDHSFLGEANTRNVLGLAGQEAFIAFLNAFKVGDTLEVSQVLRRLLDMGLDIGFFLRELVAMWRNLFMLRQSGMSALPVVPLPAAEAEALLTLAEGFSISHIHACWQMSLEGQRRVLTSLEPALALELLLLNLAMLPQLLSLEKISVMGRSGGTPGGGNAPGARGGAAGPSGCAMPRSLSSGSMQGESKLGNAEVAMPVSLPNPVVYAPVEYQQNVQDLPTTMCDKDERLPAGQGKASVVNEQPALCSGKVDRSLQVSAPATDTNLALSQEGHPPLHNVPEHFGESGIAPFDPEKLEAFAELDMDTDLEQDSASLPYDRMAPVENKPTWDEVLMAAEAAETPVWVLDLLRNVKGIWEGPKLILLPVDGFVGHQIRETSNRTVLDNILEQLCGFVPMVEVRNAAVGQRELPGNGLRQEIESNITVQAMLKQFDARIIDFGQIYQ